jgi:hypothetical protein
MGEPNLMALKPWSFQLVLIDPRSMEWLLLLLLLLLPRRRLLLLLPRRRLLLLLPRRRLLLRWLPPALISCWPRHRPASSPPLQLRAKMQPV